MEFENPNVIDVLENGIRKDETVLPQGANL